MSKKTIAFTMPLAGPRPREPKAVDPDALSADSAPVIASEGLDAGDADIEPDEWVRTRDLSRSLSPGPMAALETPRPFHPGAEITIDLAAERNLMEAVSLGFFVPFALGWFWFVHAMARRQRMWGV